MSCAARNSAGQAHRSQSDREPRRLTFQTTLYQLRTYSLLFIESLDKRRTGPDQVRDTSNALGRACGSLWFSCGCVMCLWVGGVRG